MHGNKVLSEKQILVITHLKSQALTGVCLQLCLTSPNLQLLLLPFFWDICCATSSAHTLHCHNPFRQVFTTLGLTYMANYSEYLYVPILQDRCHGFHGGFTKAQAIFVNCSKQELCPRLWKGTEGHFLQYHDSQEHSDTTPPHYS